MIYCTRLTMLPGKVHKNASTPSENSLIKPPKGFPKTSSPRMSTYICLMA